MNKPIRVLIADDQLRARQGLRAVLTSFGLIADASQPDIQILGEAADGAEAIRLVEANQPDVVLMDAHMPGTDGLRATRYIKDHWPNVKIILLTMYANYRTAAISAGADDFILKGCEANDLLDVIRTVSG